MEGIFHLMPEPSQPLQYAMQVPPMKVRVRRLGMLEQR